MRNRSLKRVGLMMAAAFVFMPFPAMLDSGQTTQAQVMTDHAIPAQSTVGATTVVVNGKSVGSITPTRVGDTYYVPFKKIASYLGYKSISYTQSTQTYRATDGSVTVKISVGSTEATKGDEHVHIQAPRFIESTGHITVDSISSLFNVFAFYNAANGTIQVQMPASLYKVQSGDTLFLIAQAHHTTVDAIRSANGLTADGINPGQFLRLPGQALTREMDPVEPQPTAPESTLDQKRQAIVSTAKRYLGKPYKFGASPSQAPNTFDCSSFTQYVYKLNGITLPRDSRAQGEEGVRVAVSDLKPGDLLFFKQPSRYSDGRIGHVSIYAGNGAMVQAVSPRGTEVKSNWQNNSYYKTNFLYAKRIIR